MRLITFTFLIFFATLMNLSAQNGYEIKVDIENFEGDTLILGYYLGSNQYVKDTTLREKGKFVFKGDELLPVGVYLLITPPKNEIIQVLIGEDQEMSVFARYDNGMKDISFKGSDDNEAYYSYVNFIQEKKPQTARIRALMDSLDEKSEEYQGYIQQVKEIDAAVEDKTQEVISLNPDSYAALMLRANQEIKIPEFEGSEKEVQLKRFHYFKKHYKENMFLSDPRVFRTPTLYDRVEYYTDKLTMRDPDSIMLSIDEILQPLEAYEPAFQYYLVHFLNKFAKSKIVGHDGVYVHIVDNYYSKGKAPWTKDEQLAKILKNANDLRSTLIGMTAPNLTLYDRDKTAIKIHDIESEFTVIYFWNPDCGHCKKSTPKLIEFYKTYKDKGVKVLSVCGKSGKDYGECWKYIDEKEDMNLLYNLGDEYYKSKFKTAYYVKTTPKIYVLDKDKKILSKGIGVEQLPELMKFLMQGESID